MTVMDYMVRSSVGLYEDEWVSVPVRRISSFKISPFEMSNDRKR